MFRLAIGFLCASALLIAGCSVSSTGIAPSADEKELRDAFAAFQTALKPRDFPKLWDMLAAESREAAETAAKKLRDEAGKASADERSAQAKNLGLSVDELLNLDGQHYLKTKRFPASGQQEVVESKYHSASVQGKNATVVYDEDNNHSKVNLSFVRENQRWKVAPIIE